MGLDGLASAGYCERPGLMGIVVGYGAATPASFDRAFEALLLVLSQAPAGRNHATNFRAEPKVGIEPTTHA